MLTTYHSVMQIPGVGSSYNYEGKASVSLLLCIIPAGHAKAKAQRWYDVKDIGSIGRPWHVGSWLRAHRLVGI